MSAKSEKLQDYAIVAKAWMEFGESLLYHKAQSEAFYQELLAASNIDPKWADGVMKLSKMKVDLNNLNSILLAFKECKLHECKPPEPPAA
jgi:hypothetical protein